MTLLRTIILNIALLVQALPVSWSAQGEVETECAMSCCAAAKVTCCCVKTPVAPALPSPASTPPATGREIVPAVMWTAWVAEAPLLPLDPFMEIATARFDDRCADSPPHVRLPVLFCCFLI